MKLTLQTRCLSYFLLLLFTLLQLTATAQVKVYENFEYTAGESLSTQNGGVGFSGPWDGQKDGTGAGGGTGVINAANLDGNTLGGSADLGGQWTERYRNLNGTVSNTVGTSLWVAFSYQVAAAQEYSGLSLFNGTAEHLYIGRVNNDFIGLGSASATQGGAISDLSGTVNVTDMHYYLAKIDFLGGSDMKVSLWADYGGTTAPLESDITHQVTGYYNNASAITQIRIAGSCPTAGLFANFDGVRLSSSFFEKTNYTLTSSDVTAPSVPTTLVSTAITATTCTLSWTASTDDVGVTGYDVFKDGVLYGSSATTTINIVGLTPLTTYSFTVKSKDAAPNLSAASVALSVTTLDAPIDLVAPSVPTALVSSAITATTFTLSWTASTDDVAVTGYDVYKDGVLAGSSVTTSYNATGLTAATIYSYTVKAKDAAGNESLESAALSVTTASAAPPAVIKVYENFEYTAGETLSTQNGGVGFSGPWDGQKDGTAAGGGTAVINTANLDGNTLGGSADLGGQWTERYRDLNGTINNTAGTSLWVAFSYKVAAAQEYSGLSLFNGTAEHLYIGRVNNDFIGLGSASATQGGANSDLPGTVNVTDMHYYLAKIDFLGGSDMKVSLWADYGGSTAPLESDITHQVTGYYNNASAITQIRIAGSCPTAGLFANFDGVRLSSSFFEKTNYTLTSSVVTPPSVTENEKFEYTPGNLDAANGGTGFSAPWAVAKGINIEAADLTSPAGTPTGKARFVTSDPIGFRNLSKTYTDEAGKVYWIEFSMQGTKKENSGGTGGNTDSLGIDWGGISLFNDGTENGYLGKDGSFGVGLGDARIENALYGANRYLVKLVMSGDNNKETAYMWLNYTGGTEPAIGTANITTTAFGQDSRLTNFNRIRLAGGGAWGTVPDIAFDNIGIYESFPAASVAVQSVLVSPATASIAIGSTQQLSAAITPANASNTAVTWSSSNDAVATVSNSGLVSGITAGTVTITATTADGNKTSTTLITVTGSTPPVTVIEKFEYAPANLDAANGGTGFSAPWAVSKGINIEDGDLTSIIGTPVGKARFVTSDPIGFRNLSKTYTDEAGKVYWIEFSMQGTKKENSGGTGGNTDSLGIDWGGISLFNDGTENGYLGKDGNFGVGLGDARIENALYGANHYLVKLVMSGDNNKETAYMWLNYTGVTEPTIGSANITTAAFGQDSRLTNFNRIRLAGGGAWGSVPDIAFDNIRISETFQSFSTLPVTLLSFNAAAKNNGNSLSWKTSTEINTMKFIVERKEADGSFKAIATVAASRNANGSTYEALDANPLRGINYYRLKMVDADGRFAYSRTINIASAISAAGISIYPNPVKNGMINIMSGNEPIKSISVISIAGIRMMNLNVQSAFRTVPVNVGTLSKGVYIIEIVTTASIVRKQVVIE